MHTKIWSENLMGRNPANSHRWGDNIITDLREIGWEHVDWIAWLRIGTSGELL
jgi:hypothetical protein